MRKKGRALWDELFFILFVWFWGQDVLPGPCRSRQLNSGAHLRGAAGPGERRGAGRRVPREGAFPLPPSPDLSCPSSLWLFWLVGNIFREREAALPDLEPSPAEPMCPALRRWRSPGPGEPAASPTFASRRRPGATRSSSPAPGQNSPSFSREGRAPGPAP